MTANDARVPRHYAASYVHWDLVVTTGMGYLEGNATKYVARWRKKGGRADLDKALHYVAKLREVADRGPLPRPLPMPADSIRAEVTRFAAANGLVALERQVIEELACWRYVQEVDALLRALPAIFAQLADGGSAAERVLPDPEPIPISEENKHAAQPDE